MAGYNPASNINPASLEERLLAGQLKDIYLCAVVQEKVVRYVSLADTLEGADNWRKDSESYLPRNTRCLIYKIKAEEV